MPLTRENDALFEGQEGIVYDWELTPFPSANVAPEPEEPSNIVVPEGTIDREPIDTAFTGLMNEFDTGPLGERPVREGNRSELIAPELIKSVGGLISGGGHVPETQAPEVEESAGRKSDNGKARMDLIPPNIWLELGELYAKGCALYADRNWELGLNWSRVYAAMQRHANKFWAGEEFDEVDGQRHIISVIWCAIALAEYKHTHPELDDRPYA